MSRNSTLIALALAAGSLAAAPIQDKKPLDLKAADLARRIDHWIEAGYTARQVKPAPLADDAEYLRRVYLDLTGRIPSVAEVHRFLANKDSNKRAALVEELLASKQYLTHFGRFWRNLLIPPTSNPQMQFQATTIETWARQRLEENLSHEKMVYELLTYNNAASNRLTGFGVASNGPNAFYQANEFKAENLAANTARVFLGVKLECAQCHDHPFARWTRTQFWELAAFFPGINRQQIRPNVAVQQNDSQQKRDIEIPGLNKKVQAKFLDGTEPKWEDTTPTRQYLADWIIRRDNPYFARATINRYWEHFFGIGLVDPVDDASQENPPSHPELQDELAEAFILSGYDSRFLIQAITMSKAYQRTSVTTDPSQNDVRAFGRMNLKGMTAEQLFDSLCQATGYRDNLQAQGRGFVGQGSIRGEFLSRFANPSDRRIEHQTSILQALALMNGRLVADVTSLERSQTLAAIIDSPFLDTRSKLQTLFYTTLSRPMRQAEADRFVAYVEKGGPSGDTKKALADVFWVLLNSSEFSLNH